MKKAVSIHSGIKENDINADIMLESFRCELSGLIIAGFYKNGGEFFSASFADGRDALWLVERFKKELLDAVE